MPPTAEYLTLDGTPIPVNVNNGGLDVPARSGELVTGWENTTYTNDRASERKREWPFTTPPVPAAEWLVLQPLLEGGGVRVAGGWAISRATTPVDPLDPTGPSVPVTADVMVEMGPVVHHGEDAVDIAYEISFRLREV